MSKQKVLFLCPHNAAKSVLAMVYFNQQAEALGLNYYAESAGTEPDKVVMPVVATMLAAEGIDVSRHSPRQITAADLTSSLRIVSMGCSAQELGVPEDGLIVWGDVPSVSQEPIQAQATIHAHVNALIAELRGNS
jgi:protein-tyrosine-phosphatase